ncbi:helicase-like transcription factor isoform X2 [Dasypus novemcinctus]|uniref:helicase-like transcription factor isoform X2 n=1 Tax=Dasypus novemcinctus TaxID=9361 RepID=UPI00265E6306|nr:helicase-like transcription factor isoform X2 [Dasypus novemcinctus]XP_058151114.1 helicase-like transcription factor isoform X2 [Dasypus novemcinctus]
MEPPLQPRPPTVFESHRGVESPSLSYPDWLVSVNSSSPLDILDASHKRLLVPQIVGRSRRRRRLSRLAASPPTLGTCPRSLGCRAWKRAYRGGSRTILEYPGAPLATLLSAMSWMFKRDPVWKYLQTVQYGVHGSFSRISYPTFFPRFEFQDIIPPDDFLTSDEELDSVLFGTLRGHVVGLRYYTGVVNNNEMVALQRDPNNPYDKNAIKVNNVNGNQVGHLKKDLAAALAHIMDNKLAQIEGVVPFGANNAFTMPLHMTFWGKEENRKMVLDQLKKHGFKLGPAPKTLGFSLESGWGSGRAGPSYSMPVHAAVQMTTEQLKTEFDKLFEDLKEDDKTHEMEPAEAIETPLLPHQKQALAWMVARENSEELPPFWEQRSDLYYNTITNFSEKDRPENVHGGILADDMGLGKTLTAIAVILTNFHDGTPLPVERIKKNQQKKECNVNDESVKLGGNNPSEKADGIIKGGSRYSEEPSISDVKEKNKYPMSEFCSSRPKRRKTVVQYIESSDSEDYETSELPQKMKGKLKNAQAETKNRGKGSSKVKEDAEFACALSSSTPTTKKKMLKKVASAVESLKKSDVEERPRTTLIICPLSVLSNWIDQFGQHIQSDVQLNFYVYYGPDRIRDPALLSKQDIVLTTYNILTHDYGTKGDSPLHSIRWLRVILDEGHAIRNPNAQQTKAVLDLEAERRWVLTGTPIQNSLKDLWSLLSFLKLKPFLDREWWHRTIQRPVTMGDEGGLRRLQSLIKNITLRRTKTSKIKGKPVLELPERKVFIQHITLTDEERKIYQSVKNEGRATIGRYFNEGTVLAHYADVLGLLLRLRQICCHTHLLTNAVSSTGPSGSDTPEELRNKLIRKMKLILSSGSDEECAICLDSLAIPVITHCAHVFCKPCICQVIQNEQPHAKCPLCRNDINGDNLLECPPEELTCHTERKSNTEWTSSSKINALMHALIDLRKKDPNIKSLVVSQFTTFLSLIETPLKASGFVFTRLDGSMAQKKRVESIQCFQNTEAGSPTIMLLSLKAGGVGLNLSAASRVFLMDPAWNPAAEDQCFDRCHRLGQKQEVIITKFIVKDSVEENMLKIQNTKRELAAGAFGTKKTNANEVKQAKINEIRTLIDL